jgi:hypothetical protein
LQLHGCTIHAGAAPIDLYATRCHIHLSTHQWGSVFPKLYLQKAEFPKDPTLLTLAPGLDEACKAAVPSKHGIVAQASAKPIKVDSL